MQEIMRNMAAAQTNNSNKKKIIQQVGAATKTIGRKRNKNKKKR